uniref:SCP domain-containing protein n=1 Tax=Callorhinchus milii TaxID=7868 RepID=A0A4W3GGJ9_CALMI
MEKICSFTCICFTILLMLCLLLINARNTGTRGDHLKWDYKLERVSKGYAARCIWDHNPKRGKSGENLFVSTGTIHAETAVIFWYNEISDYTFDTNSCVPGKMCGHYTQVMWYNSQKLACAKHVQLPTTGSGPYKQGPSCSECPSGYTCENKLCSKFIQDFAVEHQSKQNLCIEHMPIRT